MHEAICPRQDDMVRTKRTRERKVAARTRQFVVVLTPEPAGWYSVTCPSLPGCHSQGRGIEHALDSIREAIELTLDDMADHGERIPPSEALLATVQI
jgi:predicted RNase H-like HicB family nuclease